MFDYKSRFCRPRILDVVLRNLQEEHVGSSSGAVQVPGVGCSAALCCRAVRVLARGLRWSELNSARKPTCHLRGGQTASDPGQITAMSNSFASSLFLAVYAATTIAASSASQWVKVALTSSCLASVLPARVQTFD